MPAVENDMGLEQASVRPVPRVWPALIALGAVVVLSMTTVLVDLVVEHDTGEKTTDLVDNALRSITLVDDLRFQAHRLVVSHRDAERLATIMARIRLDAEAYDPLATYDGERQEWHLMQSLLARAQHDPSDALFAEIEASAARLVAINQSEAQAMETGIRGVHRNGILLDLGLGGLIAGTAAAIAYVLIRAHRRERELLRIHLQSLDDRARELEAFTARVSHDLKGPLSPIMITADMLDLYESSSVRQAAKRIRRSAERMTAIIDDLLALSVSGHPPTGKADVGPVVTELLDELQPELRDAAVDVHVAECTAACPPNVLTQILRNVIGNSAKYRSPERPLELHIDAHREGDRVEIAVGDNGIGMDANTLEHAFDPFYRARGTKATGHGLGLAIVKRTIDALGGTCALNSSADHGTRLTMWLPAA
jgi:signal transduction histidine kinase